MMHSITKDNRNKKIRTKLFAVAFWLLIWELVYRCVKREILIVSPVRAFGRLLELAETVAFWQSVSATCIRVVAGFVLALFIGSGLAVLTSRFPLMYTLFHPLLETVKATPVASIIILALVWLSNGRIPSFIAFLMVLPIVWSNLYAGFSEVDCELLEMAQVFQFTRWKKIRLIYLPALMPYFIAACTTGLGAAWKSTIAAEVIAHPQVSMGRQIYNARIYLETADLFAWTIAVVVMSVLLQKVTMHILATISRKMLGTVGGGQDAAEH